MNAEAFDAEAVEPPATLPAALEAYVFTPLAPLIRGNEPGEVAILIEIDAFSG